MQIKFAEYPGRADLLVCRECSSRTTVVAIPADEQQEHTDWHAEVDADG